MRALQTPSAPHEEFDRLCERIEDFEPLPDHSRTEQVRETLLSEAESAPEPDNGDQTPMDGLIMAGLVSPV